MRVGGLHVGRQEVWRRDGRGVADGVWKAAGGKRRRLIDKSFGTSGVKKHVGSRRRLDTGNQQLLDPGASSRRSPQPFFPLHLCVHTKPTPLRPHQAYASASTPSLHLCVHTKPTTPRPHKAYNSTSTPSLHICVYTKPTHIQTPQQGGTTPAAVVKDVNQGGCFQRRAVSYNVKHSEVLAADLKSGTTSASADKKQPHAIAI
eukprot:352729-Chlamydomonas_euryale.AAC.2